jgi:hypothetical protein
MTTPPVLSKVHTFAQDLERVRGAREDEPARTPRGTSPSTPMPVTENTAGSPTQVTTLPNTPIKLSAGAGRDASYPATIITDKKRRTFNLTQEVSTAVGDWWNERVKTIKGGKKPTYSVPSVDRRKGVVHTATTLTGRGATSDHREVVAKLKHDTTKPVSLAQSAVLPVLKKNPVASPIPPSFVAETAEPQVGYETESRVGDTPHMVTPIEVPLAEESPNELPSLEMPESELSKTTGATLDAVEPPVANALPRITPIIPLAIESVAEDLPEPSVAYETEAPAPVPITPLSFPKINPVAPTPVTVLATAPAENAFSQLAEVPKPTFPTTSSEVKVTIANRMKERVPTTVPIGGRFGRLRTMAPYLAGLLFITITAGGIAYFMMMGTTTPSTDSFATDLPTSVPAGEFPTEAYIPNSVTAKLDAPNKASLYAAIENSAGLGDGLFIVMPLSHDAAFPLGTREILGLINRQLAPDFVGNINNIQLGMYREEPVILLSISDENSARGGMFRWESTLSQDLSPWFGAGLRFRNTTNVTNFTDGTSAGRDVRILTDDIGTERITYGFINQNVLLITTNVTAFLNVANSYSNN